VPAEAAEYKSTVEATGGRAVVLPNVTTAQFRTALDRERPDVLIFCGHGDTPLGDRFGGKQAQALTFMNSESGRLELERDETVAKLLCDHATAAEAGAAASGGREAGARLQLLVLNACCTQRLARLLQARAPPALRHVLAWETKAHDGAALVLGAEFVRRRLRRREQLRRETPGAAFEGAKSKVLLVRIDAMLHGVLATSVPLFAFADPDDAATVNQDTYKLLDGSGAVAAGVPVFVDLHVEVKRRQEKRFADSVAPQLRAWIGQTPSAAPHLVQLREQLNVLEISAAEGSDVAQAEIAALVQGGADSIRATAVHFTRFEELKWLSAIVDEGNALFHGVYHGMLKQVRNNGFYDEFCARLDDIAVDATRYPQRSGDATAVYAAAAEALPRFERVLAQLVEITAKAEPKMRVAPLKHVFRVLQKHALRVDGGAPTHFETACDIVRGSIVCGSMNDLLRVLDALLVMQAEGRIVIVRVKNRFTHPTAAGWADAVINFICLGGGAAGEHVCELQLVHAMMLKARKEFGGHNAYASFREAAEVKDFAVGGILVEQLGPLVEALDEPLVAMASALTAASEATAADKAAALDAAEAARAQLLWKSAEPLRTSLAALQAAQILVPDGGDAFAAANAALEQGQQALCMAEQVATVVELARVSAGQAEMSSQAQAKVHGVVIDVFAHFCTGLTTVNLSGCNKVTDDSVGELARRSAGLTTVDLCFCYQVTDGGVG
jgi:hypothetical protein